MSALEFFSSFFTPAYLFLFLNLIVATIFITSRRPSPSLIGRVRSINLSRYKFDAHPDANPLQRYHPGPDQEVVHGSVPLPLPLPLARAPSLLDRFWSVNSYQHDSQHANLEPEPEPLRRVDPPAPPLSRAPSSLLDPLKSMNFYYQKIDQSADPPQEVDRSMEARDAMTPLDRAPSLLERVRSSIKFPSFYEPEANREAKDMGHAPVRRIRSESERVGEQQGTKPRMRKTTSEKSADEEEEINAKADDFIQRFRQQLRLQRLDSIMRYKDMLTGSR